MTPSECLAIYQGVARGRYPGAVQRLHNLQARQGERLGVKSLVRKQLDENGEEIANVLTTLGLSRPIARTLSYLKDLKEVPSVELERVIGLHQPEVSIAMRDLKERDWISEREEKKPGKGRPFKIYSFKISFNEIIAYFEKENMKESNDMQLRIRQMKKSITITSQPHSMKAYPGA